MDEFGRLLKAANFAAEKHRDQRRKDAEQTPYINHPISVAETLRIFGVDDENVLVAAILHDVLEDTSTSPGEIAQAFGMEVLAIVQEVTDNKSLAKQMRKDLQVESAFTLSEGARWVRLADKICNLQDMAERPPVDWSIERLLQYVDWCERVIKQMPNINESLETRFETVCEDARRSFLAQL
ncbi:MAG: guanosine-3',5'-bis(diphosphate) 3'-pyrophosphohydrolase [Candidatus Latescibacterota bacterium]|jgi:guanosine-3',5'-bis(diphosphate) 3'-pyrophosphohydrolase